MEHSDFFISLKNLFQKLPGIGPRQANRFVWTLLDFTIDEQKKLGNAILDISQHMKRCAVCFRVFPSTEETICSFCKPANKRIKNTIMVVEHDSDLLNVEKSAIYKGLYHVLGGPLDPLGSTSEMVRNRIGALYNRAQALSEKNEIILALSPTKTGDFTAEYIKKVLEPFIKNKNIKISRPARGLATGVELEYADEVTLKQAIDNRK